MEFETIAYYIKLLDQQNIKTGSLFPFALVHNLSRLESLATNVFVSYSQEHQKQEFQVRVLTEFHPAIQPGNKEPIGLRCQ